MQFDFAPRFNILTGDNGLGKTFILDVAWWALTRTWATQPAWPHPGKGREAQIVYGYEAKSKSAHELVGKYNIEEEDWTIQRGRPGMTGLVLYMRIDGGFSVWDPARNYWKKIVSRGYHEPDRPAAFNFSAREVWEGMAVEGGPTLCNGLIRDWVTWQDRNGTEFMWLRKVLESLSAGETERLAPGPHMRVHVNESRDFPTLALPYGNVPVIFASAGMRRILALAYLIVWTYTEHISAARLVGDAPTNRFTVLIDEVEAHLHPQWQRMILPAVSRAFFKMEYVNGREFHLEYPEIQVIASTHAPLIMASIEPFFDATTDKVIGLDIENGAVLAKDLVWRKRGDATAWLTSEVFDLASGRSLKAESTIEEASRIMKQEDIDADAARRIHAELQAVLGDTDPFWIRWCYLGQRKGWLNDSSATAE